MSDFNDGSGRAGGNGETGAPDTRRCSGGSEHGAKNVSAPGVVGPLFRPECLGAYPEGYELIPLHGPADLDARGRPIGKAPVGRGWRSAPKLSLEEARAHMAAGQNVGVRMRDTDLVVDVDPRNFEPGDDPLARLGADLKVDLTGFPTVITGSGGKHIYMRKPEDAVLRDTLAAYQGIEFKSIGRQVVAAGSVHPSAEQPYVWDDDPLAVPLRDAPMAPAGLIELARRPERAATVEAGDRTPEELAAMLEGLDPTQFKDHSAWLELMMACHHATAGEGRDEWIEWSTSDPQYAADAWIIGRRWDSLHAGGAGRRVTERSLFKALLDAGRGNLVPVDDPLDDFPDDLGSELDGADPVSALIKQMNSRFCAVLEGGDYSIYMADTDDLYSPPRQVLTRLGRAAFRHYHENELVTLPDQNRRKSVADVWLQHPKMRKYPGIVMDPEGRYPDKLNLWQGWAVEPEPGDWSLMRELIEDVLCNGDRAHADYVVRWIAFMLQSPGVQPEAAIVFRGSEGTGKGTLGRVLMRLAGSHGITVSSPKQLAGNFNAHLRNAVFVFADEALWPGDKEAEGTLKQLVTEPVISFEQKGKDVIQGRNLVHLMMASNEEWVVPAGKDARRFAVFDVADARRNDRAFFKRLHSQMNHGGLAGMLYDLLAMDLTGWHPSQGIPKTQALAEQKLMSLDPASRFWMEVLQRGEIDLIGPDKWAAGSITLRDERTTLIEDFDRFLKRSRIFSLKATPKALTKAGRALGLEAVKVERNSGRGWVLPPLHEARALFEQRIGADDLFI